MFPKVYLLINIRDNIQSHQTLFTIYLEVMLPLMRILNCFIDHLDHRINIWSLEKIQIRNFEYILILNIKINYVMNYISFLTELNFLQECFFNLIQNFFFIFQINSFYYRNFLFKSFPYYKFVLSFPPMLIIFD